MGDLCDEYGISRKTGHKIWSRFQTIGLAGLADQRRAPKRIPHRTSPELRSVLFSARKKHPTWGPKKLRAWLLKKEDGLALPSANTIGFWLKREGLVKPRTRRHRCAGTSPKGLTQAAAPNDVWCIDFKGQFRMGNGRYCYPLTITDLSSRFLVACTAFDSTKEVGARLGCEDAFREYGLPQVIRSDNGEPFASVGLDGMSSLSVWWLRLGIRPERIKPAHPEQNGQHERMHLTLKLETTRPAGDNLLQQQERFDRFRVEFNEERPHEALEQQPPASQYVPSERRYPEHLPELLYPLHDFPRLVSSHGTVRLGQVSYYLSRVLAGEYVGLREVADGRWLVSFMSLDLGYLDERSRKFERAG